MEQQEIRTQKRLEQILREDDIHKAYLQSVQALEARYEAIAAALPPQEQKVLVGYAQCLKLMQLRAMTLVSEKMEFPK